jgi:hypothetical protein
MMTGIDPQPAFLTLSLHNIDPMKRKLSKQTLVLLLTGNLCIAVSYLLNKIIPASADLGDFIKGFGVAMVIMSLFIRGKNKRAPGQSHKLDY